MNYTSWIITFSPGYVQFEGIPNLIGNQLNLIKTASALQETIRQQYIQKYGKIQTLCNYLNIKGFAIMFFSIPVAIFTPPLFLWLNKPKAKRKGR